MTDTTHTPADVVEALRELERAATGVNRLGAVRGPQWLSLTTALLRARAALQASHQGEVEQIVAWLDAEYESACQHSRDKTDMAIPVDAIHMIDVLRRCIKNGDHRNGREAS